LLEKKDQPDAGDPNASPPQKREGFLKSKKIAAVRTFEQKKNRDGERGVRH